MNEAEVVDQTSSVCLGTIIHGNSAANCRERRWAMGEGMLIRVVAGAAAVIVLGVIVLRRKKAA